MKEGWNDSFGVRRKSTKAKSPDSELITLNCCADKINEYFCSPFRKLCRNNMVVVAQLVRASDCDSEGRGFETHHPPFFNYGILRFRNKHLRRRAAEYLMGILSDRPKGLGIIPNRSRYASLPGSIRLNRFSAPPAAVSKTIVSLI